MSFKLINKNAEKLAQTIVGVLKSDNSVENLIDYIKNSFGLNINIIFCNLDNIKCSGSVYYLEDIYYINIEKNEIKSRQIFTICHEIAHILRNTQLKCEFCTVYNKRELERFCNRFAAAFLMPKDVFIKLWDAIKKDTEVSKIVYLASRFEVSFEAVRNRARDLDLIYD